MTWRVVVDVCGQERVYQETFPTREATMDFIVSNQIGHYAKPVEETADFLPPDARHLLNAGWVRESPDSWSHPDRPYWKSIRKGHAVNAQKSIDQRRLDDPINWPEDWPLDYTS